MSNWTRNLIGYISETEIDGTVTGVTDLTTTQDEGVPFHPLVGKAVIITQSNVLLPCTINVGTNSPNYDNIISGKPVGGPLSLALLELIEGSAQVPPNTLIKVKVVTACTPVPLTTPELSFKVGTMGFDVEF